MLKKSLFVAVVFLLVSCSLPGNLIERKSEFDGKSTLNLSRMVLGGFIYAEMQWRQSDNSEGIYFLSLQEGFSCTNMTKVELKVDGEDFSFDPSVSTDFGPSGVGGSFLSSSCQIFTVPREFLDAVTQAKNVGMRIHSDSDVTDVKVHTTGYSFVGSLPVFLNRVDKLRPAP